VLGTLKSRVTFAQELAVLLCLVSLMISIGQGEMTSIKQLNSFGSIDDPSHGAQLLLQSSFDTAQLIINGVYQPLNTIATGNEPAVYLTDANGIQRANHCEIQNGGTWIEDGTVNPPPEGIIPHSGARCIGGYSGASGTVRMEWELNHLDGSSGGVPNSPGLPITGDYYYSIWLYFPLDWSMPLGVNNGDNKAWDEMMNPFVFSALNPRTCLHIHRANNGQYDLTLEWTLDGGSANKLCWMIIPSGWDIASGPYQILGKWTKWSFFCHRTTDYTQAYMKMWLNDVPLVSRIDGSPVLTDYNGEHANGTPWPSAGRSFHMYTTSSLASPGAWALYFAKSYMDFGGGTHYLYADDLEVWDGIP